MYPHINRDFYLNSRSSKQTSRAARLAPLPPPTNWRDRVIKTYTSVYKKLSRTRSSRTHAHARTLPPLPFFIPLLPFPSSARAMQTTRRAGRH